VESIAVHDHVMRALVDRAKCVFQRAAIVVKYRKTSCVATEQKRSKADMPIPQRMTPLLWRNGLAHSSVQTSVVDHSIAESIFARNLATNRNPSQPIVLDLPML
jgi:hypothetical protein